MKSQTSMNTFANATPQISVSLRVSFERIVFQTVSSHSHSNCKWAGNSFRRSIEPAEIGLMGSATENKPPNNQQFN